MAGWSVVFRAARESDREIFDWRRYGLDQLRPSVVTVNGKVALVMEGEAVVFQNGTDGIADLIRAHRRLMDGFAKGLVDHEAEARARTQKVQDAWDLIRSFGAPFESPQ